MSKHKNRGRLASFAAAVVVSAGFLLGVCGAVHAQGRNLVYVMSNIGSVPNMNSVFAFSNDGNGNLTPLRANPYLTNGTGWYDPTGSTTSIDADNNLIIDPTGSFLYAVNGHTNTVSAFSINSDGTLTSLRATPYGSGGQEPVSVAFMPHALPNGVSVLALANKANDPNQTGGVPGFNSFIVNSSGRLRAVTDGVINLAAGDYTASVNATTLNSHFVYGLQFMPASQIFTYEAGPHGVLTPLSSIGPPLSGQLLLGVAFHPIQRVLYVGIPNGPAVAVYTWANRSGSLTLDTTVTNQGAAICWLATDPAGTRLYTAESVSGTVSVYKINGRNATSPVQLQHFTLTNQPANPTDLKVDPTGKFLYVLSNNLLHVLNISPADGTLTETIAPVVLNVPTGEHPAGLAVLMK